MGLLNKNVCILYVLNRTDLIALDIFGRRVNITVIARRSRFFAGARYLKRGSNDQVG
jgi:phosphatidylinositol 3,5-bisphosphate 5-phosphatase